MADFSETHISFYQPIDKLINDRRWKGMVTDLMFNGEGVAFADVAGQGMVPLTKNDCAFATKNYFLQFCQIMSAANGVTFDENLGIFAGELPDGNRGQVNVGTHVDCGFAVSVRVDRDFEAAWSDFHTTPEHVELLENAILEEKTIMVSGGTSSGKTTLTNLIVSKLPSHKRTLVVEDKQAEIKLPHANAVRFTVPRIPSKSNTVTYSHIVDSLMRHRPDNLVVSEISIENAFVCLRLMGTGHGNVITTIHADSPADAMFSFKNNMVLGGAAGDASDIYEMIASRVDLVVQVQRKEGPDGKGQIRSITSIETAFDCIKRNRSFLNQSSPMSS